MFSQKLNTNRIYERLAKAWSGCAYAQAGLSLFWSHLPHCWKSQVAAHILLVVFILCFSLSYWLVCSLQPCGHLLGKSWPFGCLSCDVFWWICHFPIWCPRSCVVLDCIDSWSLLSSLLCNHVTEEYIASCFALIVVLLLCECMRSLFIPCVDL